MERLRFAEIHGIECASRKLKAGGADVVLLTSHRINEQPCVALFASPDVAAQALKVIPGSQGMRFGDSQGLYVNKGILTLELQRGFVLEPAIP